MTQTLHLFLILAGMLSFDATAQWAWIDHDGHKVFSDRAPSPSVPEKNIFKRPGQTLPLGAQELATNNGSAEPAVKASAPAQTGAGKLPSAGVDKELAERLKKAAQAQALQSKAEEDRISQLKADNCQRAKLAQNKLNSGVRLSQVNGQGKREVMDKAARAEEAKNIQSVVDSNCQ